MSVEEFARGRARFLDRRFRFTVGDAPLRLILGKEEEGNGGWRERRRGKRGAG
jgi:hypothetical protein